LADNKAQQGGLEALRQKAIDALCETFAQDQISVEEFERRVDEAHEAVSTAELRELLADIPVSAKAVARRPEDRAVAARPDYVPDVHLKERDLMIGVFGGGSRMGHWIPARKSLAIGLMGGVKLDYREVALPPGVTEVRAIAVMGGIEIIVPPDVVVDLSGLAIMGAFEQTAEQPPNLSHDTPILRVTGFAMMGGVEVKSRYAGESPREARKRRRALARSRRSDRS